MGLHVAGGPLRAEQHAEHVDVHDPVEVAQVVVQEAGHRAGDAGVVRHDVQAAEVLDGEVDQRLHLVGVGDVGLLERGDVAELAGERLPGVDVDVGDDDPRALLDEALARWRGRCRSPPPVTMATFPASSSAIVASLACGSSRDPIVPHRMRTDRLGHVDKYYDIKLNMSTIESQRGTGHE